MSKKSTYEAPQIEAMMERMFRGLVKRAAAGEIEAVQALQNLAGVADTALSNGIAAAHEGECNYSLTYLQGETGLDRKTITRRLAKARA